MPYLLMRLRALLILFTIILASAVHEVNAAKIVVRNFKLEPNDQTAMNAETSEIDLDGNRAALIRIYTSLKKSDLAFGGSARGITSIKEEPGQILLYVPSRSQQIRITHNRHEPVLYHYETAIEAGRTYSMNLTVEGKEVSLVSSTDGATLTVDGDSIGKTPIRTYLPYGPHSIKAQLGTLIYDDKIDITPNGPERYVLKMEDENLKYGDVTVTVPGNAEIYFQGIREGVGAATFHLKDGVYPVETRKKDHDPRITNITVNAGQATEVALTPPAPHMGYLELATEPANGVSILSADTLFSESKTMHLPVAHYELRFERGGYFPVTKTYKIEKGQTVCDSIRLQRKQYVKRKGMYAGAGFTYSNMPGVTLNAGCLFANVDLSLSYTIGVTKSKDVDWYDDKTEFFAERTKYRMDELTAKVGYQFALVERFGITPFTGYMAQMLHGSATKGNNFTCGNAVAGVKFAYVPIPRFSIFFTPEYAIPVISGEQYDAVAKHGGFEKGGFHISAGINIYIL